MFVTRRFNTAVAAMCALLDLAPSYYALTMRWEPKADFDLLGFVWLLGNIPQLLVCAVAISLLFAAVVFGLRAWWDV